jgi:ubiquinone/menaquinone biosynthesis C-methylase UbiE
MDIPITTYDGCTMPFKDGSFDAVLLFFTLHHTSDPIRVIDEAIRVSKKSILIFEEVYENLLQKYAMICYDIAVNTLMFGSRISVPRFYKQDEWMAIFKKLKIRKLSKEIFIKPWYYPPRRIFFCLSKKLAIHYVRSN